MPDQYVKEGKIVLNVDPGAVQALELGNDLVRFNARFNGRVMSVRFPTLAVLAVYARENGQGMMFGDEAGVEPPPDPPPDPPGAVPPKRPGLRVVK